MMERQEFSFVIGAGRHYSVCILSEGSKGIYGHIYDESNKESVLCITNASSRDILIGALEGAFSGSSKHNVDQFKEGLRNSKTLKVKTEGEE